ncbi:MAG: sigma-54-dependent Fis family transcriptional regulator, partial [Rhodoferax sp.]|nr:sigma-54-dependent Fis family transcriptional regulator [Rhodoferax sp.]
EATEAFAPLVETPSQQPVAASDAAARTERPARAPIPSDLQAYLDQQEREILIKVLRETNFNRTATAARLGLSLRQIRYRIERLNIAAPQDPDRDADSPDGHDD